MIQIWAIRDGQGATWFERGLRAPSVDAIFANPLEFIKSVPKSERWNLYYTVSECLEEPGRKLSVQHHIQFDVDGIRVPFTTDDKVDEAGLWLIAQVVCKALKVDPKEIGVLFSGNGLQFLIRTTTTITDPDYFGATRAHYGAICDRIDLQLMQAGMEGKADRSVWSTARLMRYPETLNRKPGKAERRAFTLNHTFKKLDYDITKISSLPTVAATDHIAKSVVDMFPTPDTKAIMSECKFLKWCQTSPADVSEAEWYAAISTTARFENGRQFTHEMSKGHPGYSFEETEQKIDQALEASGPRTCKNINAISSGKCVGCKHHDTKMTSPILIEGPDNIRTAKSGFHNIFVGEDGKIKIGKPNFEDLRKQFQKDHEYVSVDGTGIIRIWNGKSYDEFSRDRVHQYALDHFNPRSNHNIRNEFAAELTLRNMVDADFFSRSIEGKMNFQNGVLDVKSGLLKQHSKEYGFRSVLGCDYDPKAVAPRFLKFMDEVTMGRESLVNVIQEFLGYTFANGSCVHQKGLMLVGTGENGKSVLVQLLRNLTGREGSSSLSVKDMADPQSRYIMEGKTVNIAEENDKNAFKDPELIKNFIRGGSIRVKKLYAQPYEYFNKTKLIMLCNEVPYTTDVTHGFFRSFIMIPFDQVFSYAKGNKDPDIFDKLAVELPGIFNWIMEGYRRLEKQNKFSECVESDAMVEQYKADSNSFVSWANENIQFNPNPNEFINRTELYLDYKRYCEDSSEKFKYTQQKFMGHLRDFVKRNGGQLVEERKKKSGQDRGRCINHIKHDVIKPF